jgi:CRP-like cAMP-binding protein
MPLPPPAPAVNQLLARLPRPAYQRLLPHLQPVHLEFKKVLYKAQAPIDYAYFVTGGVASALAIMENGSAIEVATIGDEGLVGFLASIGIQTSLCEVIMQVSGSALRIKADALRDEAAVSSALRQMLRLYHEAYLLQLSQSIACNGLHTIGQRCGRWLLMTQDRTHSDEIPLTQEFLAIMLGVRRASITEVLRPLEARGLISKGRGQITILNRPALEAASCECHRVVRDAYQRLLG